MSGTATSKPVAWECRFAVYCPPPRGERDDYHLVKEIAHYPDGSAKPHIRLIRNFTFPFWVTKRAFRNHQEKKEWELLERLNRFESTRASQNMAIAKALEMPGVRDPHILRRSPYLYGADLLSTSVIRKTYMERFPAVNTPYSVAAFDVETDAVHGTGEIIMATLSYRDRIITAICKSFLANQGVGEGVDIEQALRGKLDYYIGDVCSKRGVRWEVVLADSAADIVLACFRKAHEWKPDFVAIWNINFDMPKMIECLEHAGLDPKDVFSDPAVPGAWRHFRYKVGSSRKVTASGKVSPIPPHAQWHTVFCPSSFYFIDAMCVYWHLRSQKGKDPSYALDAILRKTFGERIRKLRFEAASHLAGISWHQFMQQHHPLEYVIYNVFDCVSMELLDEENKDLQLTLPGFAGWTDFCNFNSQPRRLVDRLHYFCLEEKDRVIGTTSDSMRTELDAHVVSPSGWIVTLPAHLVADNGLCLIEEAPTLRTSIRAHSADLDALSSYPTGEETFNISKETTSRELCRIEGVSEHTRRMQGINLSGGATNAVEVACGLFGLPSLDQWLDAFARTKGLKFVIPAYSLVTRRDTADVDCSNDDSEDDEDPGDDFEREDGAE
ncbi:hypothetical protein HDG34_003335 [Paraburkholderia sp. HC6.4b]|uniref:hypothetical protein n=1 Tax=unclassified Paraburkholderia TaxID=2615204 RepID=UPI00161CB04E|nr:MULTISPECIES: hypothetical protein [unclassified Paraburkholderia]MBB5409394.1 hypothetical protein [Paraburkholderia sp. HC6.4b]MBB5451123.1 hypothetical protein [Paraburkholderia sp. Kb1A]